MAAAQVYGDADLMIMLFSRFENQALGRFLLANPADLRLRAVVAAVNGTRPLLHAAEFMTVLFNDADEKTSRVIARNINSWARAEMEASLTRVFHEGPRFDAAISENAVMEWTVDGFRALITAVQAPARAERIRERAVIIHEQLLGNIAGA